jgi:hypothetical protein
MNSVSLIPYLNKCCGESFSSSCEMYLIVVGMYLILFYIERGLHSRTEIGEREINGNTLHNLGAIGNRTLFSCLPLPPPPTPSSQLDKRRHIVCYLRFSPLTPSPPPHTPTPFGQFEAAAVDFEDGL